MFRVSMRVPRRKGIVSGFAVAVSLAVAGLAVPVQAQSDAPQYTKSFAKPAQKASEDLNAARNKPEVVAEINNLVAASDAIGAAKGDAAIAAARAQFDTIAQRIQGMTTVERKEVEALVAEAKGPDDKYLTGELMYFLGTFSGDRDLRLRGLKLKLDSGVLKAESVASSWIELGQLYNALNRRDEARAAFEAADRAGDKDGAIAAAATYFAANRVAEGLDYLEGMIMARTVAGQPVPGAWYSEGLIRSRDLGDATRLGHWAALYAMRGNSPESWNVGIGTLLGISGFGVDEKLDAFRLMDRTGALLTEGAYLGYLSAAAGPVGVALPGEVAKVAKAAQDSGTITDAARKQEVASVLTKAEGMVEGDQGGLARAAADARKAATGKDALETGEAFLSYGMAPEAEEMLQLALDKGGIDTDRALTRLAIAQSDQGKYEQARANFAKVTGTRALVAAMWVAYIDGKTGRSG